MMPDNLDPKLNQEQNQQLIKSGWEKLKQNGAYEIDFFGDLLMQAISRGSRKRILIFNTNENSPNDPIVVVSPETYGGTSDSAVPVVVAYNGGPHGALRRFKRQKIPQRWKVAFLEGIDEYIHPPKFQKLAIGGF